MKLKKIMVSVLAVIILISGVIGSNSVAKAFGETKVVHSDGNFEMVVKPGETSHVRIPIKAVGNVIFLPSARVVNTPNSPFTFSQAQILTSYNTIANGISTSDTVYVEFDVKVSDTATIGTYPVILNITGEDFSDEGLNLELEFNLKLLEEKVPAQLTAGKVNMVDTVAGCDTDLSFIVKNEGEITARNIYINLNYGESGIIKRYTLNNMKIGDLEPGQEHKVSLPVSILPNASAGMKNLTVNFLYKNIEGKDLSSESTMAVNIDANENAPDIEIESVTYKGELKPGDEFTLVATLRNNGSSKAEDVKISVDKSSISIDGFIENYFTNDISVGDINEGDKKEVGIPLIISEDAIGGYKELKLNINYEDTLGIAYSSTKTIYPEVIGAKPTPAVAPNIIISGVKQFPDQPKAGEDMKVSFTIENKSPIDITELKILAETSGITFMPVDSEPYQYIELLKGNEKKTITIPLTLSEEIQKGLNDLNIFISYKGGNVETIKIPILNVINDLKEDTVTKPKLMVSNYSFDVEELRAGSTFNFTFDLYNTNAQIAAKNMRVTITQDENIFSVTQGSNSFFINKIEPGENVTNTIEMKVKSDATTKPYPMKITIDYEFDGAKPNPTTGEIGEKEVIELNLLAIENARPVVDYVNVYSYDGMLMVGNPCFLSFEFYNMGKSMLNNVVATVEGDFSSANGSMTFLGNVMAGDRSYAEFEVIPNVEGMAYGIVRITFEDSNGDQVEFIKEFEQFIESAQPWEPGPIDGDFGEVFNPETGAPKKEILKTWLFIVINVGIFIIFIPITRGIIIAAYKSKLRKKEDANY